MKDDLIKLRKIISKEKRIADEINLLDVEEKKMIESHINVLKDSLRKHNEEIPLVLKKISLTRPLVPLEKPKEAKYPERTVPIKNKKKEHLQGFSEIDKKILERIKKKEETFITKKVKKPSRYVKTANKFFASFSKSLSEKKVFDMLNLSLIKANMQFVPSSYLSVILFTTLLSIFLGILIFVFFLLFNFGPKLPIITYATEDLATRFLKTFWIMLVVPIGTFVFMYFYPSMEKKSIESKINRELPFVTIHMSAISGSMIEPSKIFSIINSTGEYPNTSREFIKLINEINVHGYDLVSALRKAAFNSPSSKLAELFNGLASSIISGGDIQEFFDKRSQNLFFEYKLENEKRTKTSETFMDIYISMVIAAPMIFMLVLMMIKISGLGISLGAPMIGLMMVLGVSVINIVFLTFLYLKQPNE